MASYYGHEFAGSRTANGERYNPNALTAAHRSLPMGSKLRVTNTANGKSVMVRSTTAARSTASASSMSASPPRRRSGWSAPARHWLSLSFSASPALLEHQSGRGGSMSVAPATGETWR